MKNNRKPKWIAVLLCAIMIFFASCTYQESTTQPPTTDGGASAAPENETTSEFEDDGSGSPENGARKIVSQVRNVYSSADEVAQITFAHYEDTPDILLMDTETACAFIFESLLCDYADFVIEETDTTLTITRDNSAYCVLDFVDDSIYFNNFDLFRVRFTNAMSDVLMSPYVDSKGNEIYFHKESSMDIAGNPVYIDLAARDIPLDIYEGKKYIPFQTLNDLFISHYEMNYLFNSLDVFKIPSDGILDPTFDGILDPALEEKFYSAAPSKRSEALANYSTNELCLVLDLYYGLQDEHGITNGFESYLARAGLLDDLRSTDPAKANNALASLFVGYLADKHSGLLMTSPYTGSPELDYSKITYDSSIIHYWDYFDCLDAARAEAMPEGVPGYQEIGNTAYVTFDSFTLSTDRFLDYSEKSTQIDDTIGLIIYAHSMITRENSPIENVVLDLSCNSGGYIDSQVYVAAWLLGYCDFRLTNPITNSFSTTTYTVDTNLDGVFDENDCIADKKLYCIISPFSFSATNNLAVLLKESGMVTLIGDASGGGTCAVQMVTTADGALFGTSSSYQISGFSNDSYYNIDRGVAPHIYLSKFESYFNREALTEYLNNLI